MGASESRVASSMDRREDTQLVSLSNRQSLSRDLVLHNHNAIWFGLIEFEALFAHRIRRCQRFVSGNRADAGGLLLDCRFDLCSWHILLLILFNDRNSVSDGRSRVPSNIAR